MVGAWRGRHGVVLGGCAWQTAVVCGRQRRCARAGRASRSGNVACAGARVAARPRVRGRAEGSGWASSRRRCGAEVELGARSSEQRPGVRARRRPGDVAARRAAFVRLCARARVGGVSARARGERLPGPGVRTARGGRREHGAAWWRAGASRAERRAGGEREGRRADVRDREEGRR